MREREALGNAFRKRLLTSLEVEEHFVRADGGISGRTKRVQTSF